MASPQRVEVQAKDLIDAMKLIGKLEDDSDAEVVFSTAEGNLLLLCGGSNAEIACVGQFTQSFRLHANSLDTIERAVLGALRGSPSVQLVLEGEKLGIGGLKIPCKVDTPVGAPLLIAQDAPLLARLKEFSTATPNQIKKSGMSKIYEASLRAKDEAIAAATKSLKEFGIEYQEIEALVDKRIGSR